MKRMAEAFPEKKLSPTSRTAVFVIPAREGRTHEALSAWGGERRLPVRVASGPSGQEVDFSAPKGEPALIAPDSVSWRVVKNPVSLFIGGLTAVLLELAEPRVRDAIWHQGGFRRDPLTRLWRTGLAAMVTIYGPRSAFEFLEIMVRVPVLPGPGRWLQQMFLRAAVEALSEWVRDRLELGTGWCLRSWERRPVRAAAAAGDRLLVPSSRAVRSCRRLGLPADYLYRR